MNRHPLAWHTKNGPRQDADSWAFHAAKRAEETKRTKLNELVTIARSYEITTLPDCTRCEMRNSHLYMCSYHEGVDDTATKIAAKIAEFLQIFCGIILTIFCRLLKLSV